MDKNVALRNSSKDFSVDNPVEKSYLSICLDFPIAISKYH